MKWLSFGGISPARNFVVNRVDDFPLLERLTQGFLADFLGICPGERLSTYPLMEWYTSATHFLGEIEIPGKALGFV